MFARDLDKALSDLIKAAILENKKSIIYLNKTYSLVYHKSTHIVFLGKIETPFFSRTPEFIIEKALYWNEVLKCYSDLQQELSDNQALPKVEEVFDDEEAATSKTQKRKLEQKETPNKKQKTELTTPSPNTLFQPLYPEFNKAKFAEIIRVLCADPKTGKKFDVIHDSNKLAYWFISYAGKNKMPTKSLDQHDDQGYQTNPPFAVSCAFEKLDKKLKEIANDQPKKISFGFIVLKRIEFIKYAFYKNINDKPLQFNDIQCSCEKNLDVTLRFLNKDGIEMSTKISSIFPETTSNPQELLLSESKKYLPLIVNHLVNSGLINRYTFSKNSPELILSYAANPLEIYIAYDDVFDIADFPKKFTFESETLRDCQKSGKNIYHSEVKYFHIAGFYPKLTSTNTQTHSIPINANETKTTTTPTYRKQ